MRAAAARHVAVVPQGGARAALVDATRLVCVAPPVESLPSVDLALRARTSARVALALNAQNFVHAKTPLFVFYSGVIATSAQPRVGPPAGGVEVRVGGTNLNVFGDARDARCRFHRWAPLVPAASLGMAAVAARVADVPPTFKGEDVMVCRTPPFPAGTVAVELSLNGRDFHGTANPPLAHEFACEQRDHLDVASCVADASCGHCADQLPDEGIDHTAYGIVQDRYGCARCHGDGCGRGPAEGTCRLWTFETRILEHPATAAEARGLALANVSRPFDGNESALATGSLLPGQARFYRVRPPHASARLLVSARTVGGGDLQLVAKEHATPTFGDPTSYDRRRHGGNGGNGGGGGGLAGDDGSSFDLGSERSADPLLLRIPRERIHCHAADAADAADAAAAAALAPSSSPAPSPSLSSPPTCDEWVIGVRGNAYVFKDAGDMSPQAEATAFELRVRWELDAADFDCAECGHACDAAPCGWAAGASTHFLRDEAGRAVARLTNDTHQHGTLWARQPQPYEGGFTANFSFRVHGMSVCTKALELFGVNTTAAASRAGVPFTPMADLVAAGEEITHYLVDHPDLPFEQLPPPRGVPPQLADEIDDAENANPDARYGRHTPTRGGRPAFAPYIGLEQRCPDDAGRVGGEGFAFVLQAEGLDAAGCNGTGVGYAAGGGDGCVGVASSVAIQFDTHHNARTVRSEECVDYDSVNKVCNPGGLKVRDTLQFDRQHAVSVFLDGDNAATSALKTVLLSHTVPMALDDGREHEVVVEYVPPPSDRVGAEGALQVFYDGADQPLLHLPITLPLSRDGRLLPGAVGDFLLPPLPAAAAATAAAAAAVEQSNASARRAYMGFTASTGEASEMHDILRARFCHRLGCADL